MQTVSRFEANLLRILAFFLRREPPERAMPLLEQRLQPPTCLSKSAIDLACDALTKGSAQILAQRGGWREERHPRVDGIVAGRLWERTEPSELGLHFSEEALAFLMWITAQQPGDGEPHWGPKEITLTAGDRLLLFLAHEGLRGGADSLGASTLRRRQPYNQHGLCWLAYPEDYVDMPAVIEPNFEPWTTERGADILEALQTDLCLRWVSVEASKEDIRDPRKMLSLGQSQERVLRILLRSLREAHRLDLARFLLRALAQLLTDSADASLWIGRLDTKNLRLADRMEVQGAALGALRLLESEFSAWSRWAKGVGYLDEEYQSAKLWLSDWEYEHGERSCERIRALLRQMDPMRQS